MAVADEYRLVPRKTLTAAGHAEEGLAVLARLEAAHQGVDGLRLVAGGGELAAELELGRHEQSLGKPSSASVRAAPVRERAEVRPLPYVRGSDTSVDFASLIVRGARGGRRG